MEPYPSAQCKPLAAVFVMVRRRRECTVAAESCMNTGSEGVGS